MQCMVAKSGRRASEFRRRALLLAYTDNAPPRLSHDPSSGPDADEIGQLAGVLILITTATFESAA